MEMLLPKFLLQKSVIQANIFLAHKIRNININEGRYTIGKLAIEA
jgi:hypothetical protein